MDPEDAVRQVEYIAAANLAEGNYCRGTMYRDAFERVAEDGTDADMAALLERISHDIAVDEVPRPEQARRYADRVLANADRTYADGGQ